MSMRPGRVTEADVAQSVERTTLNRVVVGSIPTVGVLSFCYNLYFFAVPL